MKRALSFAVMAAAVYFAANPRKAAELLPSWIAVSEKLVGAWRAGKEAAEQKEVEVKEEMEHHGKSGERIASVISGL